MPCICPRWETGLICSPRPAISGNTSPIRPPEHEVPESYLDDETFAAILKEAEKYLGFPYGATCSQLKRLGTCPMIGGEKKDR